MTARIARGVVIDALAGVLRGDEVPWGTCAVTPAEFVDICADEDLTALICRRLSEEPGDWPAEMREALAEQARAEAAREGLRGNELVRVLRALAQDGIRPILLKGTALAYSVYESPVSRPRGDTDLLVRRQQVDGVRRVMSALGYGATPGCDGELLFCQFAVGRRDEFGVDHAFDFHWKISTQAVFADLLGYDELAADAVYVPALGPDARAAGHLHALLLACIHPAMHHRNAERLIWMYDIHMLVSRMPASDLERFVSLATTKRVARICAQTLAAARVRFGSAVPDHVIERLAAPPSDEPSAAYLDAGRRWDQELMSSVRAVNRWSDRARLLREVAFPGPRYMLSAYGIAAGWTSAASAVLPALYVHRLVRGVWRILRGRK